MENRNRISRFVIDSIEYLPVPAFDSMQLLNQFNSEELSPKSLAEIIQKDQSIVSRILALANSPLYGLPKKISTVEVAISILGLQTVKDIVTGLSIINATSKEKDRYFNSDFFNYHSYLTGYISQLLAHDFNYPVKSEAFVAGLLHDIGIPIIHRYLNTEFKLISELKFYRKISQSKAEIMILGRTHSEIGSSVASKWNFPDNLIDAIKNHHTPLQSVVNPKLTAIVHIADYIANRESPQFMLTAEDEKLDKEVIEILNIPDESFLFDMIFNISELVKTVNLKDE